MFFLSNSCQYIDAASLLTITSHVSNSEISVHVTVFSFFRKLLTLWVSLWKRRWACIKFAPLVCTGETPSSNRDPEKSRQRLPILKVKRQCLRTTSFVKWKFCTFLHEIIFPSILAMSWFPSSLPTWRLLQVQNFMPIFKAKTKFDLNIIWNINNWRGAWNKALSGTWCNVKFSFCFTSKFKAIWKENLVVNQMSLRAFFHTPLQLTFDCLFTFGFTSQRGCYFRVAITFWWLENVTLQFSSLFTQRGWRVTQHEKLLILSCSELEYRKWCLSRSCSIST